MDYVEGESLWALLRRSRELGARVPIDVAAGVMVQALHGLHAAHEAKSDLGEPLELVHRDVSPQNLLVGTDGMVRVLDFGVAKALGKLHTTREGQLKGKLGYLAPEQIFGQPVTRRSDVFAAGVVLWEAITGRGLFAAECEGDVLRRIMEGRVDRPALLVPDVPPALDRVVMRALAREPSDRFDTALAMAEAVEHAAPVAAPRAIAAWMRSLAREGLEARARLIAGIEGGATSAVAAPPGGAAAAHARGAGAAMSGGITQSALSRAAAVRGRGQAPWARALAAAVSCGAAAAAIIVAHASRPTPAPPVAGRVMSTATEAAIPARARPSRVEAMRPSAPAATPPAARRARPSVPAPAPAAPAPGGSPRDLHPRPASSAARPGDDLYTRE